MITWGLVSAAMMFVQTPVQFYIMRFLLGAAEAGFFPAVIYYLSTWFPIKWRGRAVSRFYIGVPLGFTVMGLISAPILALDGSFGLHGWQWLLMLEGLPAVVMGLIVLVFIPDTPATVDWLDADERHWLQATLAADAASIPETGHSGIWRAITNPIVLLFGGFAVFVMGFTQAFSLSAPQILGARTGLDVGAVGWLVTAGGLLGAIAMLANSWASDRTGNRFWHIVAPLLLLSASYFLIGKSTTPLVVMAGYLCLMAASFGYQAVYPAYVSQSIPPRDLGVGYAMINSIAQAGAFVSPILFGMAKDATGSYDLGLSLLPLSQVAGKYRSPAHSGDA
jgi:ACS family tartrate transporter-like MFS transporter